MSLKHKRKQWMGMIGGAGVVAGIGGFVGLYSVPLAIFLMFGIWILGAVLVNLLTD